MNQKQTLKTEDIQAQLEGLNEQLEGAKIDLTPEVEAYIEENAARIQAKLQAGENVYPRDMQFVGNFREWLELPDELREEYDSVESFVESDYYSEAQERGLDFDQWYYLRQFDPNTDLASFDVTFEYKDGKIIANDRFPIVNKKIKKLPRNLVVNSAFNLNGCEELAEFPEGLEVKGILYTNGLKNLRHIRDNVRIVNIGGIENPTNLETIGNNVTFDASASFNGCKKLKSIGDNFNVGGGLNLDSCENLKSIGSGLVVDRDILLRDCFKLEDIPEDLEFGLNLIYWKLPEKGKATLERMKTTQPKGNLIIEQGW